MTTTFELFDKQILNSKCVSHENFAKFLVLTLSVKKVLTRCFGNCIYIHTLNKQKKIQNEDPEHNWYINILWISFDF